jgi:hypothetical protein
MMSTFWHAVLDNIRPVAIWAVQLTLYYVVTDGKYGEQWTLGSWLELVSATQATFSKCNIKGEKKRRIEEWGTLGGTAHVVLRRD